MKIISKIVTTLERCMSKKNNIIIKRGFSRHQLCNIEELILRYYNHVDSEKTWFFSSFGTKINKIEGEKE